MTLWQDVAILCNSEIEGNMWQYDAICKIYQNIMNDHECVFWKEDERGRVLPQMLAKLWLRQEGSFQESRVVSHGSRRHHEKRQNMENPWENIVKKLLKICLKCVPVICFLYLLCCGCVFGTHDCERS